MPVQDIWLDYPDAHNQNIEITGYPTEKNPALLARIIKASSNPSDLVLDCFSGSGTTLAVASQLGRRWIGIDSSSQAIIATLRRFTNGLERMGDFVSEKREPSHGKQAQPSLIPIRQGESVLSVGARIYRAHPFYTSTIANWYYIAPVRYSAH